MKCNLLKRKNFFTLLVDFKVEICYNKFNYWKRGFAV